MPVRQLSLVHRESAERLLGAIMVRPSLLSLDDRVARVTVAHMPTPQLRDGWLAVQAVLAAGGGRDGKTLAVSEVLPHGQGVVDGDYLHQCMANGGFPREIELAGETAELVIEAARSADRVRQLREAAAALEGGEPLAVIDEQVLANTTVEYGMTIDHDLCGALDTAFSEEAEKGLSTGIGWLDDVTGGILAHEFWLLGGRYKGGKTRTARHMTLALLLAGAPVSFFAIEGTWLSFGFDLLALLATKYLYGSGAGSSATLSGRLLRRLGKSMPDSLTPVQMDAIMRARKTLRDWQGGGLLRIYSKERDHGGIQSIDDVRRFLRLDSQQGVKVGMYDYAQRFDDEGKLFESMRRVALTSQDIVQELPVSLIGLVQLNEARNNLGEDDFTLGAGIKGGGDLPASADTFLTTSYDIDSFSTAKANNRPDAKMTLKLWFSRFEAACEQEFMVNRTSGYIMGAVEKKAINV